MDEKMEELVEMVMTVCDKVVVDMVLFLVKTNDVSGLKEMLETLTENF
ncbi:MAG: hypothetical protein FWE22_08205 [Firmicutes bacterium]|nr:hypothetical protein [Bacillota bacterium]